MAAASRRYTTILDRWTEQVRYRPQETALRWLDRSNSFAEVGERVDRIAHWLGEQGVVPGEIVANLLPRSADALILQLAVLRAGAVHLAVDPLGPVARISAILADAGPALVIDPPAWQRTQADRDEQPHGTLPTVDGHALAYLVYTSGSSGTPKGVLVEHAGLANLLVEHEREIIPLATERVGRRRLRVAHAITLSFDAAWDPLLWLVAGHELHLLTDDVRADATLLEKAIAEHALDVVEVTPSLAEQLVRRGLLQAPHAPALLLTGGEAVGQRLWDELAAAPATTAVNLYGPSECTVFATWSRLDRFARPVIGYPITGTGFRVVDSTDRPVPAGDSGELVLSGQAVARGYHNRPQLTAQKFGTEQAERTVAISEMDSQVRYYRTGDLVRRGPDGALEFLGRVDGQVKIRGHRIEPGEVEAVLRTHPGVSQAVVRLRQADGFADLVAYVVRIENETSVAELMEFASTRLPRVMVPSTVVMVPELPLTPHGKVDRAALPLPRRAVVAGPADDPRNPVEHLLAREFRSVLKLDQFGRNDSFFELGGHSLLAAVVADNLRQVDIHCTLRDIMENPRIADLADVVVPLNQNASLVKESE